ncbi:hypothetical protein [Antrihabitans sp. YC2-6]|uniref:hypothetical protein n=1 Tax=Antrihabitans sp. YC2-6 TaxID=2799498 RepID=UPI001F3FBE04|nr:hypothetical protein [Antrihabitans sp. YC2-6]
MRLAAHGLTVFVAPDADGAPVAIPPWYPRSNEDRALDDHAKHLIELRTRVESFTPIEHTDSS